MRFSSTMIAGITLWLHARVRCRRLRLSFVVGLINDAMQRRHRYPKRPMRIAFVVLVVLSVIFGAFLPLDERLRDAWPTAFGYCVFLAVASIGLLRLGRGALWILGLPAVVALAPGIVGVALLLGSVDSSGVWLQMSLYLLHALAVWGLCLVIRGWTLYFTQSHGTAQP